jgi:hypothetical protein
MLRYVERRELSENTLDDGATSKALGPAYPLMEKFIYKNGATIRFAVMRFWRWKNLLIQFDARA